MSSILAQLELDQSFFVQMLIFGALFLLLTRTYFKPFLILIEARHRKTVEDREAAERLLQQASGRFEEYQRRLDAERASAKKEYEEILAQAKKEETALIAQSRDEARKITQEAVESLGKHRENLKRQLEVDVEGMARTISERLLSRKV